MSVSMSSNAQHDLLIKADSLFSSGLYTQALDEYSDIYEEGRASPSMFLKMAFIHDGLGNYAEALYYLDKYYFISADRSVVSKIEELSESNELVGYKYDDTHYFTSLLIKNRLSIVSLLVAISLLLVVYIFKKKKEEERPLGASLIQFVLICLAFVVNNLSISERGIIVSDNTLLRSGPSAGAEPIELLSKGHKVKVLERDNVWTKILWEGEEVYVRNGKLKII